MILSAAKESWAYRLVPEKYIARDTTLASGFMLPTIPLSSNGTFSNWDPREHAIVSRQPSSEGLISAGAKNKVSAVSSEDFVCANNHCTLVFVWRLSPRRRFVTAFVSTGRYYRTESYYSKIVIQELHGQQVHPSLRTSLATGP
jgi:hypothetical protein